MLLRPKNNVKIPFIGLLCFVATYDELFKLNKISHTGIKVHLECSVPVPSSTCSSQSPDRTRRWMEDWTRAGGYKGNQTANSKTWKQRLEYTLVTRTFACVCVCVCAYKHFPFQNIAKQNKSILWPGQVECSKKLTCPGFGGNLPFRGIHTPTQEQIRLLKIHTSESAPEPNKKTKRDLYSESNTNEIL